MIEIIIRPFAGITIGGKEINFEMSQVDVEKVLGKPTKFEVNNLINHTCEPRSGTIFHYQNSELYSCNNNELHFIDIPIDKGVVAIYQDIDILNDKDAIIKLSKYDNEPTPNNGKFMIFYKLGICLGGFENKRIPEKKMVTIFSVKQRDLFRMQFLTGGGKLIK